MPHFAPRETLREESFSCRVNLAARLCDRNGEEVTGVRSFRDYHRGTEGRERAQRLSKEEVASTCQGAEALLVWLDAPVKDFRLGGRMRKESGELDLHKLEIFYWVAELESFSMAAEHLSLRQPTVSAHMRSLENQIGEKLWDRVGRRAVPTQTGKLLKEQARRMLNLKNEILAALERARGDVRGELRVGGSSVPGEYILPGKLGEFVGAFPEVKPILRIGDSAEIREAILEGSVEVGFIGFKTVDHRLRWQDRWVDEMVVAVGEHHPWAGIREVSLAQLKEQPFLMREEGSGTLRSFSKLVGKTMHGLRATMELGSGAAIKEAVIEGLGVSVLSRTAIQRELQAGLLREVRLEGLKLERRFFQVTHRERTLSPVARAFIESLN